MSCTTCHDRGWIWEEVDAVTRSTSLMIRRFRTPCDCDESARWIERVNKGEDIAPPASSYTAETVFTAEELFAQAISRRKKEA